MNSIVDIKGSNYILRELREEEEEEEKKKKKKECMR